MRPEGGRQRPVCTHCGFVFYQNPVPAVAVILLKGETVLMVRRKYEPRKGGWSLPAGFIEHGEDIRQAALREVKEETNLDIRVLRVVEVFSGFHDPRAHVLLVVFLGEIAGGEAKAGDDASEIRFFPLRQLPDNMAWKNHRRALHIIMREMGIPAGEPAAQDSE